MLGCLCVVLVEFTAGMCRCFLAFLTVSTRGGAALPDVTLLSELNLFRSVLGSFIIKVRVYI